MRKLIYGTLLTGLVLGVAWSSYQAGFKQGADVTLCLVSTFQKGMEKTGLDMKSISCQAAKLGEKSPLWVFRPRYEKEQQP